MDVSEEEWIYVLAPANHPDWPGEVLKVPAARKSDWLKGTRYSDVSAEPALVATAVDIRDRQGLEGPRRVVNLVVVGACMRFVTARHVGRIWANHRPVPVLLPCSADRLARPRWSAAAGTARSGMIKN